MKSEKLRHEGAAPRGGDDAREVRPRLIVGLGNPGARYAGTRHNIGFMALDRVAAGAGAAFRSERKFDAEMARLTGAEDVICLKPQTFMNLSGKSAAAAARYFRVAPEEILVVHDDADLPFGQLRFRARGSAGGHNGIRSMIAELGTESFARLKIGIAAAEPGGEPRRELAAHVLSQFSENERSELENCLDRAADAVRYAMARGVGSAMNAFNQRIEPPSSPSGGSPPEPGESLPSS